MGGRDREKKEGGGAHGLNLMECECAGEVQLSALRAPAIGENTWQCDLLL